MPPLSPVCSVPCRGRPGKWDMSVCQVHVDGRQLHEGESQGLLKDLTTSSCHVSVQELKAETFTRQCQYSLIPRSVGLGMRLALELFTVQG